MNGELYDYELNIEHNSHKEPNPRQAPPETGRAPRVRLLEHMVPHSKCPDTDKGVVLSLVVRAWKVRGFESR